jgi:hypothetical protein
MMAMFRMSSLGCKINPPAQIVNCPVNAPALECCGLLPLSSLAQSACDAYSCRLHGLWHHVTWTFYDYCSTPFCGALMSRRLTAILLLCSLTLLSPSSSFTEKHDDGRALIEPAELRSWLTRFSSDELEGRALHSEGLGLAAAYLAQQLATFGVRPGGEHDSYFQRVRILGVKSSNRSSVTVRAHGRTRTFRNGEGVRFSANVGSKRSFDSEQIEFLGYGLDAPYAKHDDYRNRDAKGKVVVWLGKSGPAAVEEQRSFLEGRGRYAVEDKQALAALGPPSEDARDAPAQQPGVFGARRSGRALEAPDFTTVQRLDAAVPPVVAADDKFFEFLFEGQERSYADLKRAGERREPLPRFSLKGVRITFNLDAEYRVVRTRFSRNVIGVVEGSDPALKDSWVGFGAHYDHVGVAEGGLQETDNGPRRTGAPGRVTEGALDDRIWNGADDNASGVVATLAIARAFAQGPEPRRSVLFIWHTGEERGLLGSKYYADYPLQPLEGMVAHINMDMVGRNRDNSAAEADSLYLVGSDRISTELRDLIVRTNRSLRNPLKLDFALDEPGDREQIYYRSDHYSYARKGIPVALFTTGLHPDYHSNTDSADKINYDKLARIAQLGYEVGWQLANLDRAPLRNRAR